MRRYFFIIKKNASCSEQLDNNKATGDWLVVVFGLTALETVFQSISGRLPESGRKKREMIDEIKKISKQPPPAPSASAVGRCPTITQIGRTRRHWKFSLHHRTTRPPQKPQARSRVKMKQLFPNQVVSQLPLLT